MENITIVRELKIPDLKAIGIISLISSCSLVNAAKHVCLSNCQAPFNIKLLTLPYRDTATSQLPQRPSAWSLPPGPEWTFWSPDWTWLSQVSNTSVTTRSNPKLFNISNTVSPPCSPVQLLWPLALWHHSVSSSSPLSFPTPGLQTHLEMSPCPLPTHRLLQANSYSFLR